MDVLTEGKQVIKEEIGALQSMHESMGEEFVQAVNAVFNCQGRVIITGVGKAGLIGQKISATLASTGTPSYWMHAVEARHGDLGRVQSGDVVVALSNSGETEVVQLLSPLRKLDVQVISITGSPESTLARYSDIVLHVGDIQEACPLGLAPSASTTAMLVMGDALSLTVFKMREWTEEDYAFYHPGGDLGRKLIKVREVMRRGGRNPVGSQDITVREALKIMSGTDSPGAISLTDDNGKLAGFFTDGDFRRLSQDAGGELLEQPVKKVMTKDPKTISTESLAAEAYRMLRENRIDQVPVVDGEHVPVGIMDVQDWLDIERGAPSPEEA
jgi:arabinose-5-phosphate isomerase